MPPGQPAVTKMQFWWVTEPVENSGVSARRWYWLVGDPSASLVHPTSDDLGRVETEVSTHSSFAQGEGPAMKPRPHLQEDLAYHAPELKKVVSPGEKFLQAALVAVVGTGLGIGVGVFLAGQTLSGGRFGGSEPDSCSRNSESTHDCNRASQGGDSFGGLGRRQSADNRGFDVGFKSTFRRQSDPSH